MKPQKYSHWIIIITSFILLFLLNYLNINLQWHCGYASSAKNPLVCFPLTIISFVLFFYGMIFHIIKLVK